VVNLPPIRGTLLVGMGLNEFSMSATSIPVIKNHIIKQQVQAKEFSKVMERDNSIEIRTI